MKRPTIFILIAVYVGFGAACATNEPREQRPGTEAGKAAVFYGISDKRNRDLVIGAIGGGLAGTEVGSYMESQDKDLEKALASEATAGDVTIQKDTQNNLLINITAETAFGFDSTVIKPGFYATLDKIADIVQRYGKTQLAIVGYTDNVGTEQYNQTLSERRAKAVNDYLINKGVLIQRLAYVGRGAAAPRATNATEEGRRLNRRVEIVVEPVIADSRNQTPG